MLDTQSVERTESRNGYNLLYTGTTTCVVYDEKGRSFLVKDSSFSSSCTCGKSSCVHRRVAFPGSVVVAAAPALPVRKPVPIRKGVSARKVSRPSQPSIPFLNPGSVVLLQTIGWAGCFLLYKGFSLLARLFKTLSLGCEPAWITRRRNFEIKS